MCGIWCLVSKGVDSTSFIKYIDNLKRRGPDVTNIIKEQNYILGFHRLAINDLSESGNQPFLFHDGNQKIYLICNGEIYNYKNLITKYDFEMESKSDCEVIYHMLKMYDYDISKVIIELEGEFAFVVIMDDGNTVNTLVARDRIGVRPLFFGSTGNGLVVSSLLSGISGLVEKAEVFPPGHYMINNELVPYYSYNYKTLSITYEEAQIELVNRLVKCVEDRLISDRPIGCLLSGGLDSSLIVGIMVHILGVQKLKTFSIGMKGSTDLLYAQKVAKHLNTDHTEVYFTIDDVMDNLKDVVKATESWDITTNRASAGQFLLAKHISENTNIKAIINGDGADELGMGYLYFNYAPTALEAHEESVKLIKEIHRYDGLRVDRCLAYHGLEARVPFLDTHFLDFYMSLPAQWRMPHKGVIMEKDMIRKAFDTIYPDMLPKEVLFRQKEAFSDGVTSKSKSLYTYIQEKMENIITDKEFNEDKEIYEFHTPQTKEAYFYRRTFDEYFGDENAGVIPHYWLPKWINTKGEPSARVLSVYL